MSKPRLDRNREQYFAEAQQHVKHHRDTWLRAHLNSGIAWKEYAREYGSVCNATIDNSSGYYGHMHCHLRVSINTYRAKWSQIRGSLHSMTFNCLLRVLPTGVTPFQCAMLANAWKAYESIGSLDRRVYSDTEAKSQNFFHDNILAVGRNSSLSADQRCIWENTVAVFQEACLRCSNAPYPELRLLLEDIVEHVGGHTEQHADQIKANSAGIVLSEFLAMARVDMQCIEEALNDVFDPEQLLYAPVGFDAGPVAHLRNRVVYDQALLLVQLENPQPDASLPVELVASLIEAQLVHRAYRNFVTGINNGTLRLISMTPITWHQALRTGARLLRYPTGLDSISRAMFGFCPWYRCEISCTLGTTRVHTKPRKSAGESEKDEQGIPSDSVFQVCLNEITCHKIFGTAYSTLFREAYEKMTRLMQRGEDNLCTALLHFFITKSHEVYSSVDPLNKNSIHCFDFSIVEAVDGSLTNSSIETQIQHM